VRDEEDNLSLGKYLRGLATGQWENADAERRAMAEGAGAGGGFLVPTLLSAQIIDRVRNQTRVLQAGATVVPMENRTLDVARWEGDPAAAWHSENAAIAPSDATLGKVTLTAQALAANVEVSWELLEDAPNVEAKLGEAFASVFANRIDLAALYGTGTSPEPRGVKNTTAVTKTPLAANGAALTNYDPLIDSAGRLYDANEEPTGIIYSGRTARSLSKLKATDNQPLNTPEYIAAIPRYATNQVPNTLTVGTGTTTSDAFTADWRQLLLGVRTQLVIKVLAERYADNGQTGFLAWWRGDIAVARPAAFDIVTGVL
jgi:HK97 family phage major capsid protein